MDRIEQTVRWMESEHLDALVLRLTENLVMLSGYQPLLGASAVVVTPQAGAVVVAADLESPEVERGWNKNVRFYSLPGSGLAASLPAIVREIPGFKKGARVGYEGSFEWIAPPANFAEANAVGEPTRQLIREAFETQDVVDVTAGLTRLKAVKTEQEVARLRIANEIAGFGLQAFKEAVAPGRREIDIASDVEAAIRRKGTGYKGVLVARAVCQVTSGPGTVVHWRYAASGTRVVGEGETVMLEMGTTADGFWADHTRTLVAGRPTDRQREIYAAVAESVDAAFQASRPGVTGGEIDAAARQSLQRHGLQYPHHTGHATGFRYHEASLAIVPGSQDVVEEGMVHVAEPGVYIEGIGGFRIEDDVVVTSTGTERLSRLTYDLD